MLTILKKLNPHGLGELDVLNPRRVMRGLERCLTSGKTLLELKKEFELEWTDSVELLTIRHYSASDEARETEGLEILLEQRTPETVQFVFKRS